MNNSYSDNAKAGMLQSVAHSLTGAATGRWGGYLVDNRHTAIVQKKQVEAMEAGTPVQRISNNTGLPDQLKSGIENLSGHSMDDVKVHYNSAKPAQLNAHAYAQGTNIHIAPGQEKHLPHEAWHVVQQKQGRVRPTVQMKGTAINDNRSLEREADMMGGKALGQNANSNDLRGTIKNSFVTAQAKAVLHAGNSAGRYCTQCVWNADAMNNITVAARTLNAALNNYTVFDQTLDGNRVNWGYSQNTWNTLMQNVTNKSNHMRGQGISDALESLSWRVNANPRSVVGPGGAAGVDLRMFSSGGIGANRLDLEIKHAGSNATVRSQILSAIQAHGNNQTVKLYIGGNVGVPATGTQYNTLLPAVQYTVRALGYIGDEQTVRVEFYRDTNPTVLLDRRLVSWP
jgi:hypothetical protein